ncbi:MAG: hypothetical protein A2008_05075 [Candidatus Wallbacteria bacterium GWC2_49_35]|uniref:histidine kinase n=1 Tax=Candidatus Wallbacteria bacterium GWC2_49_35 TaxID=1817813 RepID=A0A1F7WJW4_9BACT|nr:MAG: hypothetical protein A2008_05075 [Candidatus Wallbacteria bacterium GWC2_49_35]HBC75239.1 hypothetical protein [Candidatus Wallbacteria bacterium]
MPNINSFAERSADNDNNLPQLKPGAADIRALSHQLIVFELLKIFSIPMDVFALNRTILNEALAVAGGEFASIIHFDERSGGVKYIQKSNGAFEKKISVPRFYMKQKTSLVAEIKAGALKNERYEGYSHVLIAPFTFSDRVICILEIFYKNRLDEKKASETLRLISLFEKCAVLAIINSLIKARNYEIAGRSYNDNARGGEGFPEPGVALTRLTFASYVSIISELLFISCPCEFCSILWFDKKNVNYRIVAEKTIYQSGGEKILARYRDKSVKLVERAVGGMGVITPAPGEKSEAGAGAGSFGGCLAAPVMNFKQSSGGLALINKISKDAGETAEFSYNDQMTALILTNYLGDFYNNFVDTASLENKIRSLSIIYSVAGAGNNLFETAGFGRSVQKTLEEIARYLKIHSCALIYYDPDDKTLKTYSSLETDISKPAESLFAAVKMDFWSSPVKAGGAYGESGVGDGVIKLSEVNIFKAALDEFKAEFNAVAGPLPGGDFDVSLRPVSFHGRLCGYLIFMDACCGKESGCGFILDESGPETSEFMAAASNILISMIKARKNYLRLNELEKVAARMERLASIGEVAAGVAHEIRNPLGGISLFATSLASGFDADDSRRKWLNQIIDAVGRIGKIVANLLDFSREEIISKSVQNALYLINDSVSSVRNSAPPPGADIKCSFFRAPAGENGALIPIGGSEKIAINCDGEKIKQVFSNLAHNSLNAVISSAGDEKAAAGCEIDIIFSRGENVSETLIYFCDNGPGIPADIADKIFRPFFTSRSKGTGLGLAITQKIMEAHSGGIKLVKSNHFTARGKKYGAIFELRLPD